MSNKTKKNIKYILILLVVLICGALAIYCAIYGMFSYLNNSVELTKSDLLVATIGEFTTEEHYSYGWLQDGGTYSKYTYKSTNLNNEYLSPIAESDMDDINRNVSDFEFWVLSSKDSEDEEDKSLYENYDFDVSIIDTNDFWFIEYDEEDTRDFEMFIFDTKTNVLYGFTYLI